MDEGTNDQESSTSQTAAKTSTSARKSSRSSKRAPASTSNQTSSSSANEGEAAETIHSLSKQHDALKKSIDAGRDTVKAAQAALTNDERLLEGVLGKLRKMLGIKAEKAVKAPKAHRGSKGGPRGDKGYRVGKDGSASVMVMVARVLVSTGAESSLTMALLVASVQQANPGAKEMTIKLTTGKMIKLGYAGRDEQGYLISTEKGTSALVEAESKIAAHSATSSNGNA